MMQRYNNNTAIALACLLCASCAEMTPERPAPSAGHLIVEDPAPVPSEDIPGIVEHIPFVPEPAPPRQVEKYTVVVNEVPLKELLFALARDAEVNVDIAPEISGMVTLNAVEQTLAQLLERITAQFDLRYVIEGNTVTITPDEPYFRTYQVDYLSMNRETVNSVSIGTQIASTGSDVEGGGGGGANNSTTTIGSRLANDFWGNLVLNIAALTGREVDPNTGEALYISEAVIPHPESGVLTVKATARQHKLISALIERTIHSANRQVMIQATIVEVNLTDQYQAGIDWQYLNRVGGAGFNITANTLSGAPINTTSLFTFSYDDPNTDRDRITATLRLLEEFGDVDVLSSPQIMAMNNQSAVLKVVDNVVYFEIEQETNTNQNTTNTTVETTIKTVPVGIVMTITPQINNNDSVILNVRPTISRINRFVNDPNPTLTISSLVPEIQVREMESIIRLSNGQIAVMGGLMQDNNSIADNAIPGLSKLPGLGDLFTTRTREYQKTELVIFLRPVVIRNPGLDGDFSPYKQYLLRDKS